MRGHVLGRLGAFFQHGAQHLPALLGADCLVGHKLRKRPQLRRCGLAIRQRDARLVLPGGHFIHHEFRELLRSRRVQPVHGFLEKRRHIHVARDGGGVLFRHAPTFAIPRGLRVRQLGQLRAHALDKLVGQREGREVRVGKHPVVVCRLFYPHDDGALGTRLPVPRLLAHRAAFFEHLGLAADLVGQPVMQGLEGVHVLQLGLHPKAALPAPPQRDVAVAAHGPFLHRAIRYAKREIDLAQLLHEQARLFRRAQIRLGDQLHERRARAVVVHEAFLGAVDAAFRAAHVHHLCRVFLQVDARDAHMRRVCALGVFVHVNALGRARTGHLQVEVPAHAKGLRPLGGLEVLGHVWVEIALAVKHRALLDVAVRGKAREHDGLNGLLVGHGQRAWQPQAHGAGVRVGFSAELQLAAAKHLRGKARQLGVNL